MKDLRPDEQQYTEEAPTEETNAARPHQLKSKHPELLRYTMIVINTGGLILTIWLIIEAWRCGLFTDEAKLAAYLNASGQWAPLLFILIQIVQTVIQVIPGALTLPAGGVIFGFLYGFVLNFIGVMIGSVINFFLARRYGRLLVWSLIGPKVYNKYVGYLNTKTFKNIFTIAMFSPVAPDDAMTLLAGLSDLQFDRFFWTLVLAKPLTIAVYMYGVTKLVQWIVMLFS